MEKLTERRIELGMKLARLISQRRTMPPSGKLRINSQAQEAIREEIEGLAE